MANPVRIKKSAVAGKIPTTNDLALGELGVNTNDARLFTRKEVSGTATVVQIASEATVLAAAAAMPRSGGTFTGSVQLALNSTESYGGAYYQLVSQVDIGADPNQVPVNGMLGRMAFLDEVAVLLPSQNPPGASKEINFEYVSDTQVKVRMRGADGTVRSATLTLS
jgi:hypothetical protein